MRANVTITSLVDYVNAHRNTEDIFVYISLKDRSSFSINASKTTLLALADGIKEALARLEQQEKEDEAKLQEEMKNIAKYAAQTRAGRTIDAGA